MLDEIDVKIIKALLADGRTRFSKIANDCQVSSPTIHNHYEKLKKAGIITGSTIILDFRETGFKYIASFFIRIDGKQMSAFQNFAKLFSPVIYCDPIKHFNVHLIVPAASIKEIEEMKETISQQPEVLELFSSVWTEWITVTKNLTIERSKSLVK
jgi:DNA-binding Lrp family transcriptional regulator